MCVKMCVRKTPTALKSRSSVVLYTQHLETPIEAQGVCNLNNAFVLACFKINNLQKDNLIEGMGVVDIEEENVFSSWRV